MFQIVLNMNDPPVIITSWAFDYCHEQQQQHTRMHTRSIRTAACFAILTQEQRREVRKCENINRRQKYAEHKQIERT